MHAVPTTRQDSGASTRTVSRRANVKAPSIAALALLSLALAAPVTVVPAAPVQAESRVTTLPSFADLAVRVTPALVNNSTERLQVRTSPTQGQGDLDQMFPQVPEDSPFYDLFRRFREQQRPESAPAQRLRALGSGFIVDAAGYVVTNNHVIDGADKITVKLHDERTFEAKLVGRDAKTDIALLKIEGTNLPHVQFGDSTRIRVGDWVVAVGNPFGLGGTVTTGILSARNRDINSGPYDDYLQIDAAINRGNSGGPLFDLEGNVIGVNTAIYSPSGGNIGIGFAIPSSIASRVASELRQHGEVKRGWLGVRIQPLTEGIARALDLKRTAGALVAGVESGSPAEKAGIRSGDVILTVGGQPVDQFRDLARIVAGLERGKVAKVALWRDGKETTLDVTITDQPATATARRGEDRRGVPNSTADSRGRYGLSLAPLTPTNRQSLGLSESVEGVVIAQVVPNSPAAEQGLQIGDVIVRIGNEKVADPNDAIEKLARARREDRPALLMINRRGETRFVAIKAEKA